MNDSSSMPPGPKGRGSQLRPANRFEKILVEADFEHFEADQESLEDSRRVPTEYLVDESKSIISSNDSPDVMFRYSLNPYRGCLHGCAYCYARPSHEYLGFNAGIDFESRIMVKPKAAELLQQFLAREKWQPELIVFSGNTDCYQPAERKFQLTRQCLEAVSEANQPISIITKNALVCRDIDLLEAMAARRIAHVNVSITTLDADLARTMEPRTSSPAARLRAIATLRDAGVPVNVMVAPVIPGLNDSEIPAILKAASEAGAMSAGYVLLRLPLTVRPVFQEWLARTQPSLQEKVESRIRACRGGDLNDSDFSQRMRGTGLIAEQIRQTFTIFKKKYRLDQPLPELDTSQFIPPKPKNGQLRLF